MSKDWEIQANIDAEAGISSTWEWKIYNICIQNTRGEKKKKSTEKYISEYPGCFRKCLLKNCP